ncbi:MAG TPA: hypothetical protein VG889_09695 [Rhizomicrobium sp.]|nr:hypothetical protein [Rhizomicrobium sp.]
MDLGISDPASPYGRHFNDAMAPLPDHVREALLTGPVAHELLPPVERAPELQRDGHLAVETGFTRAPDGSARIAVLTKMPGVTPAMWDWWFAWHGSEAERYKLWHPRAHVHAAWADGQGSLGRYVGRVSDVVEYVGADKLRLSIRFVPPSALGFDEALLARRGEVAICARGSLTGARLETGWLVHHVRPIDAGAEMRSRFWIGGGNIRPRWIGALASRLAPLAASDLLVHCAQEMNHLAGFLPALHAEFEGTR